LVCVLAVGDDDFVVAEGSGGELPRGFAVGLPLRLDAACENEDSVAFLFEEEDPGWDGVYLVLTWTMSVTLSSVSLMG
jgi:hypothetical protein